MFHVWMMHQYISKDRVDHCSTLREALDKAISEALYGNWRTVKVYDPDDEPIVLLSAKEMRDATRQQREACEVQEFPRVLPGL